MRLPHPARPLGHALHALLARAPATDTSPTAPDTLRDALRGADEEDRALSLWVLHELHYRGIDAVDDRWEWHPALAGVVLTTWSGAGGAGAHALRPGLDRATSGPGGPRGGRSVHHGRDAARARRWPATSSAARPPSRSTTCAASARCTTSRRPTRPAGSCRGSRPPPRRRSCRCSTTSTAPAAPTRPPGALPRRHERGRPRRVVRRVRRRGGPLDARAEQRAQPVRPAPPAARRRGRALRGLRGHELAAVAPPRGGPAPPG